MTESQDWREEGPFDIDEVDLEADGVPRLDLGALIVTPEDDMQIQIIADAATRRRPDFGAESGRGGHAGGGQGGAPERRLRGRDPRRPHRGDAGRGWQR